MAVVPIRNSNEQMQSMQFNYPKQDTSSSSRQRILIADDYPNNRLFLTEFLQFFGFELQETDNGRDAIALWQQWQPNLILMDLRMPIVSGLEAIRYIKQTDVGKQTAIIALTAVLTAEDRQELQQIGCDDFLCKPFQVKELIAKLSRCLAVELDQAFLNG
ncbi:MAG: response regulator [Thainema sp.]